MGLNESKGNMYDFITHTWNTIKGKCSHDCSYCYMKKWKQKEVRLVESELRTDLGKDNFIFVGSSCDMWAEDIPAEWIIKTLEHCVKFDNNYLFQSKNPRSFVSLGVHTPKNMVLCTTIETNRHYPEIMNGSPLPQERADYMQSIPIDKYVTIEPIMDFDTDELFELIVRCKPKQVNIGADSGSNNLPEPSMEKLIVLIEMLKAFTVIHRKNNLKRLM